MLLQVPKPPTGWHFWKLKRGFYLDMWYAYGKKVHEWRRVSSRLRKQLLPAPGKKRKGMVRFHPIPPLTVAQKQAGVPRYMDASMPRQGILPVRGDDMPLLIRSLSSNTRGRCCTYAPKSVDHFRIAVRVRQNYTWRYRSYRQRKAGR